MTGPVLVAGTPTPPTTRDKAVAAFLWGLAPVLLGAALLVLEQATTLLAGAPAWVLTTCAVLLVILAPVASYIGAYRRPNLLRVPVQVLDPGQV